MTPAARDRIFAGVHRLQAPVRPVAIDGRRDRHEWIGGPGGRSLKTDALDRHAAHHLIGCQDAADDAAGAVTQFDLDADAAEELRVRVAHAAGAPVPPAPI